MTHADKVLQDEQLLTIVYEALAKRHPKSRTRGRLGMPAEVVLRLLILKHVRNWSYGIVEREVRANLVYRDFTRVGGGKVPDAKTMGRWGVALGSEVIQKVHERIIEMARENKIVEGRKMRLDTTVVETNTARTQAYSLPDGQQFVGRWRASANPHHEEDHRDRWRRWGQASRSQP